MANHSGLELPALQSLQTTEQMQLLDIVDSLRAQGLSEFTALPQLIVCGDQSSGKSSVLEAISGVPFPRQDNLCTRFATEVILRRAATDGISVSIVPAKGKSMEDQGRLLQFGATLATHDDFPVLFEKAKEAMGLSDSGKAFSKDILRVEIRGPTQPQLTLVDLPGLIHSETKSQTTQDVELVTKLVEEYMAYPRSIILAVVSAKNDVGNQIVLRRAREVDPQGMRTLGIITKPDTLPMDSSSERAFLGLARNEDVKFQLGWHVVRNVDSGAKDSNSKARDELETTYFRESNFKNLPSHSVGIAALRTRLSKILFNQIRVELPLLVDDIQREVASNEAQLGKIGPSRATENEQRVFLAELSQSFQIICRDAVRGDYEHTFFQDDESGEKRLCATIMNMHFAFAEELRTDGAKWKITDEAVDEHCRTREEAINEACMLLKSSRGRELPGLPNPRLVGVLFREYSSPWEDLAREHIKNVWEATNRFLELVLQHLTDNDVSDAILRLWLFPIMDKRLEAAYKKLEELTAVHKDTPMTTNHYFLDNVKKFQQRVAKNDLEERLRREFSKPDRTLNVNDIASILSVAGPKTNPDMDLVAAEDAFDNMQAYYKVAMKLFMDNVPSLAIQAPIVREISSMLCPADVYLMSSEIVEKVAGESEEKTAHRSQLLRKRQTLDNGARICKQYAMRPGRSGRGALVESTQLKNKNVMLNGTGKSSLLGPTAFSLPIDPKLQTTPSLFSYKTASPDPPATHSIFSNLWKPSNPNASSEFFSTSSSPSSSSPSVWHPGHGSISEVFSNISSPDTPPLLTRNTGQPNTTNGTNGSESNGRSILDAKASSNGAFTGFATTSSPAPFGTAETTSTSTKKERGLVTPTFPEKKNGSVQSEWERQLLEIGGTPLIMVPFMERDTTGGSELIYYQCINFKNPWRPYSFEELRLVDYALGKRYNTWLRR